MDRRSLIGSFLTAVAAPGLAWAQTSVAAARASLAPGGNLRVSINYGNAALASRAADGTLSGVSVDIAHELARRLDIPLTMVPFDAAGKVTAVTTKNIWDVAFLARDPERAREISFTAAYVVIDGSYVVPADSRIQDMADIDHDGIRVAISARSAYDLFLTRTLKHAKLVHAGTTPEAVALFQAQKLDALAGVKQAMVQTVAQNPGLRLIQTPFMEINQAMGTIAGRPAGSVYLNAFVEDIKANGFVAAALKKNGQTDATVAPPA